MRTVQKEKDLSSCEKMIMKIVWDAKGDIPTPEVIEQIKTKYGKDYARTTVATFIQRLIEKGFVTTYRRGRIAYIHAERDEKQYTLNFLKHIREFWFQGQLTSLFSALCEESKPTAEEVEQLRKLIDEMDH